MFDSTLAALASKGEFWVGATRFRSIRDPNSDRYLLQMQMAPGAWVTVKKASGASKAVIKLMYEWDLGVTGSVAGSNPAPGTSGSPTTGTFGGYTRLKPFITLWVTDTDGSHFRARTYAGVLTAQAGGSFGPDGSEGSTAGSVNLLQIDLRWGNKKGTLPDPTILWEAGLSVTLGGGVDLVPIIEAAQANDMATVRALLVKLPAGAVTLAMYLFGLNSVKAKATEWAQRMNSPGAGRFKRWTAGFLQATGNTFQHWGLVLTGSAALGAHQGAPVAPPGAPVAPAPGEDPAPGTVSLLSATSQRTEVTSDPSQQRVSLLSDDGAGPTPAPPPGNTEAEVTELIGGELPADLPPEIREMLGVSALDLPFDDLFETLSQLADSPEIQTLLGVAGTALTAVMAAKEGLALIKALKSRGRSGSLADLGPAQQEGLVDRIIQRAFELVLDDSGQAAVDRSEGRDPPSAAALAKSLMRKPGESTADYAKRLVKLIADKVPQAAKEVLSDPGNWTDLIDLDVDPPRPPSPAPTPPSPAPSSTAPAQAAASAGAAAGAAGATATAAGNGALGGALAGAAGALGAAGGLLGGLGGDSDSTSSDIDKARDGLKDHVDQGNADAVAADKALQEAQAALDAQAKAEDKAKRETLKVLLGDSVDPVLIDQADIALVDQLLLYDPVAMQGLLRGGLTLAQVGALAPLVSRDEVGNADFMTVLKARLAGQDTPADAVLQARFQKLATPKELADAQFRQDLAAAPAAGFGATPADAVHEARAQQLTRAMAGSVTIEVARALPDADLVALLGTDPVVVQALLTGTLTLAQAAQVAPRVTALEAADPAFVAMLKTRLDAKDTAVDALIWARFQGLATPEELADAQFRLDLAAAPADGFGATPADCVHEARAQWLTRALPGALTLAAARALPDTILVPLVRSEPAIVQALLAEGISLAQAAELAPGMTAAEASDPTFKATLKQRLQALDTPADALIWARFQTLATPEELADAQFRRDLTEAPGRGFGATPADCVHEARAQWVARALPDGVTLEAARALPDPVLAGLVRSKPEVAQALLTAGFTLPQVSELAPGMTLAEAADADFLALIRERIAALDTPPDALTWARFHALVTPEELADPQFRLDLREAPARGLGATPEDCVHEARAQKLLRRLGSSVAVEEVRVLDMGELLTLMGLDPVLVAQALSMGWTLADVAGATPELLSSLPVINRAVYDALRSTGMSLHDAARYAPTVGDMEILSPAFLEIIQQKVAGGTVAGEAILWGRFDGLATQEELADPAFLKDLGEAGTLGHGGMAEDALVYARNNRIAREQPAQAPPPPSSGSGPVYEGLLMAGIDAEDAALCAPLVGVYELTPEFLAVLKQKLSDGVPAGEAILWARFDGLATLAELADPAFMNDLGTAGALGHGWNADEALTYARAQQAARSDADASAAAPAPEPEGPARVYNELLTTGLLPEQALFYTQLVTLEEIGRDNFLDQVRGWLNKNFTAEEAVYLAKADYQGSSSYTVQHVEDGYIVLGALPEVVRPSIDPETKQPIMVSYRLVEEPLGDGGFSSVGPNLVIVSPSQEAVVDWLPASVWSGPPTLGAYFQGQWHALERVSQTDDMSAPVGALPSQPFLVQRGGLPFPGGEPGPYLPLGETSTFSWTGQTPLNWLPGGSRVLGPDDQWIETE
ncbi:MAG: hypothetical protein V4739_08815 [Pseudomonadota bacterium]